MCHAYPTRYGAILIDPPWRFRNRTGKVAPEHRRLHRYPTMRLDALKALPVGELALPKSHLYLWCPNQTCSEHPGSAPRPTAWRYGALANNSWLFVTFGDSGSRQQIATSEE